MDKGEKMKALEGFAILIIGVVLGVIISWSPTERPIIDNDAVLETLIEAKEYHGVDIFHIQPERNNDDIWGWFYFWRDGVPCRVFTQDFLEYLGDK